jgi:hypothetical protein
MQELTKAVVRLWQRDPVTVEVMARVNTEIEESLTNIANGTTIGATADLTAQMTSDAVAYIRGLQFVLLFEGDDDKEESATTWTVPGGTQP